MRNNHTATQMVAGLAMFALAFMLLAAQFGHAIHHDCSMSPPLPSKAFGWAVPIETICSLAGY